MAGPRMKVGLGVDKRRCGDGVYRGYNFGETIKWKRIVMEKDVK